LENVLIFVPLPMAGTQWDEVHCEHEQRFFRATQQRFHLAGSVPRNPGSVHDRFSGEAAGEVRLHRQREPFIVATYSRD